MRVTRDSLLRIAKETVQERAYNDPVTLCRMSVFILGEQGVPIHSGAMRKIDYAKELNQEQLDVVLNGDGPCLVLAGAGSGRW
jgi:hypothetical protein